MGKIKKYFTYFLKKTTKEKQAKLIMIALMKEFLRNEKGHLSATEGMF